MCVLLVCVVMVGVLWWCVVCGAKKQLRKRKGEEREREKRVANLAFALRGMSLWNGWNCVETLRNEYEARTRTAIQQNALCLWGFSLFLSLFSFVRLVGRRKIHVCVWGAGACGITHNLCTATEHWMSGAPLVLEKDFFPRKDSAGGSRG